MPENIGLSDAQFEALKLALLQGAPRVPERPTPAAEVLTGGDARVLRAMIEDIIRVHIAYFLTEDEIKAKVKEIMFETMGRAGLPIDPDHIEQTGEVVRNVMRWGKRIQIVVNTIVGSLLLSGAYALAKYFGINVRPPGG